MDTSVSDDVGVVCSYYINPLAWTLYGIIVTQLGDETDVVSALCQPCDHAQCYEQKSHLAMPSIGSFMQVCTATVSHQKLLHKLLHGVMLMSAVFRSHVIAVCSAFMLWIVLCTSMQGPSQVSKHFLVLGADCSAWRQSHYNQGFSV